MKLRKFHVFAGLLLSGGILLLAFTGTMRANAGALYWKEKPSRAPARTLVRPAFEVKELFHIAEKNPAWGKVKQIELSLFLGNPVYRIETTSPEAPLHMVDAESGKLLSPIGFEKAREIASGYVPEGTSVEEKELLDSYLARKAKRPRPAYRILFNDAEKTEVFVDRDTGETLYVLDSGRRFGLWMIRLHELDFAGLHRPGLTFFGVGTISLTLSGLGMYVGMRRRKRK